MCRGSGGGLKKHVFFNLPVYFCVFGVTIGLSPAVPAGSEGRRRSREEDEEEALKKKQLQEEQLRKVAEKCLYDSKMMRQYMSDANTPGRICVRSV